MRLQLRILRMLLLATVLIGLAVPSFAQEQRGSIEGILRDAQGGVLPGATVEATNASGATVSSTSDSTGTFRFPSLSPGVYAVKATLEGFRPAQVEAVQVLLGTVKRVDFELTVGGVTEQVQVVATTPLIDVKQSTRTTSIRDEQLDLLPKGRDFSTILTQAAGANNEVRLGGISIDGASASENRFIVDGVETTDLQSGTSGKQVIADFIEELQVKSSGYTAEFGGATGGVVNVVTKSGTNDIRGVGLFYMEGSALSGGRYSATSGTTVGDFGGSTGAAPQAAGGRPTLRLNPSTNQVEYFQYPEDKGSRLEPGFAVGGPLAKSKAWFYVAYQPTMMTWDRTVTLLSGPTVSNTQKDTRHFLTANQTAQMGNLRTRLAFNNSFRKRDGLLPSLDGTDVVDTPYGIIRKYPNYAVSGTADYVAGTNLFIGMRGGYYFSDINDANFPTAPRYNFTPLGNVGLVGTNGVAVPASLQRGANFSSVPAGASTSYTRDQQKRLNFQADATWYKKAAGQHQIKGGVQFDNIGNNVLQGETANFVRIRWNQALSGARGAFGYYQVRSNGVDPKRGLITEGDISTTNIGLFLQDSWSLNEKLTVNVGVRTERERVPPYLTGSDVPSYPINFTFGQKLAPRLGFAYDITGDGSKKVFGSWGVFYDIFKLELPRGSFGGDKWLEYYYTLDTPDWTNLVAAASCPPACPGTLIRGPVDFRHPSYGSDAIEPDLKPMRQQEAAFGYEHQLANNLAASVRYVHKQVDRAIEDTGSLDAAGNEIYIIANPGEGLTELANVTPRVNLPKPMRKYDSVEFAFDKRYSNNWSARVSYLLSRLYGNYSGLSQGDENGRTSPNVGRLYDYPAMMFDEKGQPVFGRLPTDRPHQVKVQAIYTLKTGTSIGLNQFISSGVPVSREIGIYPPNNLPVQYLGRGSDGRTATYSQTDAYVQHEFKLGSKRAQVSFNVLNLFDQKAALGKWSTYQLTDGINLPDESVFYSGGYSFANLIAAQGVTQDPRFLKDSWYQFPINARLGLKFLF